MAFKNQPPEGRPVSKKMFEIKIKRLPLNGPVLLIIGTRPDTIKLIPLYLALKKRKIETLLCSTGQHAELLNDLLPLFQVKLDFDFKIMKPNQDLFDTTQSVLAKAKKLFLTVRPSLVVVQGDTTSAMSAALAAFYLQIPVAHVEAGLRTNNIFRPFPEEMNRRMITLVSSYHFAPTPLAASHLFKEKISPASIFCTGNTVVDALHFIQHKLLTKRLHPSPDLVSRIKSLRKAPRKILLLTAHRRESFDGGLENIFLAIQKALIKDPHLHVIFPLHPNPTIKKILKKTRLCQMPNMQIIDPLPYHDLVYLILAADGIATDSGGLQEEGVSLNKPVIILREETDRPEGIEQGLAVLVGTNQTKILTAITQLTRNKMSEHPSCSPYGDGRASEKIAHIIQKILTKRCI